MHPVGDVLYLKMEKQFSEELFLSPTASRTALAPTHPPIQWVPGVLSLEVKRPGRETNHSPTSSAQVKE
jgi:hypothetical protein